MRKIIFCIILLLFLFAPNFGILGQKEKSGKGKSRPSSAAEAAKIKFTIFKMQNIGFFLERYEIEKRMYPAAKFIEDLAILADLNYYTKISTKDEWGHPFRYVEKNMKKEEGVSYYKIIAAGPKGKDSEFIVYSNGFFIKYPEEYQFLFK